MTLPAIVAGSALTALFAASAQGAATQPGWRGEIAVGAREVSVSGDRAKYDQHVNLGSGLRLEELLLERQGGLRGPDRISIALHNFGGEPNERISVQVRQHGRYRFDYRRQRSEYLYEDLLILPEEADATKSTGGDFHHFDVDRVSDRARLDLDLSDRAALELAYDRYRKTGDSTTVFAIEREEFELDKPVDETLQIASLGVRYRWDKVTLLLTERYREHDNDATVWLPGFSSGSSPSAPATLDAYTLVQPLSYGSHEHVVQIKARPGPRTELQVQAMRTDLDGRHRARESAVGTTFTGAPLRRDVAGGGSLKRDTELLDLDGRFTVSDRLSVVAGARRHELDQRGTVSFDALDDTRDWTLRTTTLELGLEADLARHWRLTAGWLNERHKQAFVAGTGTEVDTDTRHDGYYADLVWRPSRALRVTLAAERSRVDDPLSPTAATDRERYRLRARYRWNDAWSLLASHQLVRHDNDDTGWDARDRHTEVRLEYASPSLLVSLGAADIDRDRSIAQLVRTPIRAILFDIDYDSDASFYDAAFAWRAGARLTFGGSVRRYRNDGSFSVSRDDGRGYVAFELDTAHQLSMGFRRIDFREGGIEHYDADIVDLSLRRRW